MAKTCFVCGKKIGLLEGKVVLLEGVVCSFCWQAGGYGKDLLKPTSKDNAGIQSSPWAEYYRNFPKWSYKERREYLETVTEIGSVDQAFEICLYSKSNLAFLNMFVEKVLGMGVRFSPEQVLQLVPLLDYPLNNQVAESARARYTQSQLEQLECYVDVDVFHRILKKHGMKLVKPAWQTQTASDFDEEDDDYDCDDCDVFDDNDEYMEDEVEVKVPAWMPRKKKEHDGCCDGDCANCPPHYGYRYGRWYYGHDHIEGCEFGGNKGGCTGQSKKW